MSGDHNMYTGSEQPSDEFLRDFIATQVLSGLVADLRGYDPHGINWNTLARVAYSAADAMLTVRQE